MWLVLFRQWTLGLFQRASGSAREFVHRRSVRRAAARFFLFRRALLFRHGKSPSCLEDCGAKNVACKAEQLHAARRCGSGIPIFSATILFSVRAFCAAYPAWSLSK